MGRRVPGYSSPRVIIGGRDLPAKVLKQGSPDPRTWHCFQSTRRYSLSASNCGALAVQFPLQVGMGVVVVYPERTVRSHNISPLLIPQQYRSKFRPSSRVSGSGSGVFNADKNASSAS